MKKKIINFFQMRKITPKYLAGDLIGLLFQIIFLPLSRGFDNYELREILFSPILGASSNGSKWYEDTKYEKL